MSAEKTKKPRRRVKHEKSFNERLMEEAQRFREAAKDARPGLERELLLRRAQQMESACRMNEWLSQPRAASN
jgi:hypothetical protein